MLLIDEEGTKIKVNKGPGIYSFEPLAATGKSYLCRTCKMLRGCGVRVAGYDYEDYKCGLPLPKDAEPAVVDRYEKYQVLDEELLELAKTRIVLVDIKTDPFPDGCAVAFAADGNFLVY